MLLEAFEDFLQNFKSSSSASESSATKALQDLNIDEDNLSDEYDFMDDVANGTCRRPAGQRDKGMDPKKKYMAILQDVADRYVSEITIELDDLDTVCLHQSSIEKDSGHYRLTQLCLS